ncbi:hypothetical protein CQW31_08475 [Pseudomonas sp. 382]|nr:hypothetical protein CQW31_08475 [Pseudomonas sp. 382]
MRAACRSGLVSRKGRRAAPGFSDTAEMAGAAPQPFRDARPLLQEPAVGSQRSPRCISSRSRMYLNTLRAAAGGLFRAFSCWA